MQSTGLKLLRRKVAANDLQLYKLLLAHEQIPVFKGISDAALSALRRHRWIFERRACPIFSVFSQTAGAHKTKSGF